MFSFKETEAVNENFAFFQIPDRNFILNSGSYFVLQVILVAIHVGQITTNFSVKFLRRYKIARELGIYVYQDDHLKEIGMETLKLYLECYFDLVICSFINIDAFLEAETKEELKKFFTQSNDDIFCSTLTIFYGVLVFTFPVFGYMLVRKYQGKFDDDETPEIVSVFMDGVRTDTYHGSMYNIYFLLRRFLTAVVLVWVRRYPFF